MSNAQPSSAASNSPSHIVYHVKDGKKDKGNGPKGIFTRIGAAWPHRDGKGFNIQIDVVPLDGRLNLRVVSEDKA